MPNLKIKRDDKVVVIAGNAKGNIGTVVFVDTKKNIVHVTGVKPNTKFRKKNAAAGVPGRIFEVPKPIHISNVMYYEEDSKNATRIGHQINSDGKKVRISRKTGNVLSNPTKKKALVAV